MSTKLTLRLDDELIQRAKRYAERRGTSVSQMVADFFRAITAKDEVPPEEESNWKRDLPPVTRSLVGYLAGSQFDETDYRRYLEAKHR